MTDRSIFQLTKPTPNGNGRDHLPTAAPMAQMLQEALAEIVTPGEVKALVEQILEEAKNGKTAGDRRAARQMLIGLMGAKALSGTGGPTAPQTVNVTQHYYQAGKKQTKRQAVKSRIVAYLTTEGPMGVSAIAVACECSEKEATDVLERDAKTFVRKPNGAGLGWDLRR